MLAGMLRFVCQNGMVCGDTLNDICIPHKGNIIHNVIERAFTVLDDFESINGRMNGMKALTPECWRTSRICPCRLDAARS